MSVYHQNLKMFCHKLFKHHFHGFEVGRGNKLQLQVGEYNFNSALQVLTSQRLVILEIQFS